MSNTTNGVTAPQSPVGVEVIQVSDFFQRAGILHPITVGTIAIILLFTYLRLSSNRCVAPVTLFDWLLNVALGSTLAGIVNGTSLVRGLIALVTLMSFQFCTSQISSHCGPTLEYALNSPPLIIAFRGGPLREVMRKHRISTSDLNGALRQQNIWHISEVEAVIIESTGNFSIYKRSNFPKDLEPQVLLDVPGYQKLVEHFEEEEEDNKRRGADGRKPSDQGATEHDEESANEIAAEQA